MRSLKKRRNNRPEFFYKKMSLKTSQDSWENTCTRAAFVIKFAASTISKKGLCFCEVLGRMRF